MFQNLSFSLCIICIKLCRFIKARLSVTDSYMREAREHSVIDERGASVDERCLMFVSAGMNSFIKVEVAQICLAAGSYILNPPESPQFSFSLFRVTSRLAAESLLVK